MAGTGFHPEGHKLRPYEYLASRICGNPDHAHMICRTCAEVCPEADSECIDDC
jgi:hypothetical protein